MKKQLGLFVLIALTVLFASSSVALASLIERVSVDSAEVQSDGESITDPSISGYGRYVAFGSPATNLVPGDTNGFADIFVRDRKNGITTMVSVASNGVQANNGCYYPSINADGRYVAFNSVASNLISGDSNGASDVFVRDLVNSTTTRVSVGPTEANGASSAADLNGNGRFVAFSSHASNLVDGDTNGCYDVFVRDLVLGGTVRLSVSSTGSEGHGGSYDPSISADGHVIAFHSEAADLVSGDTNGVSDVFVRDVDAGTTTRVSVKSDGSQANNESYDPSISADGRYVAFTSLATDLVDGDSNGRTDVFVHDRTTGVTRRVSVSSGGAQAAGDSSYASLSADGRYLAFHSDAGNLVPGDTDDRYDVFVRDLVSGATRRASMDSNGVPADRYSYAPSISPDGGYVVFWSYATNLVVADTNDTADVFVARPLTYTSIRGVHRYETAQMISRTLFPSVLPDGAGVVVAPGETFPEALCGAPLAAAVGGPVLLTPTTGLENGTKAELQRLAPDRVFCIGLSSSVVQEVKDALPGVPVDPIRGSNGDIYDMSAKVAAQLETEVGDLSGATAIVTVGTNFPDAIGVSPLACAHLWPVILTDKSDGSELHPTAAAILASLGITKALKVGTYATLPAPVIGLANLSGTDRYVTNANVANWARSHAGLAFTYLAFATGDKFPDALASGPYLANDRGILLLSPLLGPVPQVIAAAVTANRAVVDRVTFIACIEPVIGQVKALLP